MNAPDIVAVAAAVVALTQLIKWAGLPDNRGPWAVVPLSVLGVFLWKWSSGPIVRTDAFMLFAGSIAVATSAAGVFGFTRAAPGAISSTKRLPDEP